MGKLERLASRSRDCRRRLLALSEEGTLDWSVQLGRQLQGGLMREVSAGDVEHLLRAVRTVIPGTAGTKLRCVVEGETLAGRKARMTVEVDGKSATIVDVSFL